MQIIYGGADTWDALAYGEQNPVNLNYFQNQIQNFGNTLTEIGKQFHADAASIYERFNGSEAMQALRNVTKMAKSLFQPNIICNISTLESFQIATPVMQRWIMACPAVREVFNEQRCDGYSDSYVDMNPGTIADSHYDYRRVMDGVVKETEDDGWSVKFYAEDLHENDRDLLVDEKVDILSTWDSLNYFMQAGLKDPTNPYGGSL